MPRRRGSVVPVVRAAVVLRAVDPGGIRRRVRGDEPDDLRNGSYQEVEEFIRALRTGTRPGPTVEDILPSSRICFEIAGNLSALSKVMSGE